MANQPPLFVDDPKSIVGVSKDSVVHDKGFFDRLVITSSPNKNRIKYGYCIEHNSVDKTITVEEDIEMTSASVNPNAIIHTVVEWGRPELSRAEVMGKRVKISESIQRRVIAGTYPVEYQEVQVKLLYEIKPNNAPAMWEFSY